MTTIGSELDTRQRLLSRLAEARERTDQLFAIVRPEALYDRPIPERHRIVFYIGHLEAFDWNLLGRRAANLQPFHSQFDQLFAFGIDPTDGGLPDDPPSAWPTIAEVRGYADRVRREVDRLLIEADFSAPGTPFLDHGHLFDVAIEHRLMHAETLAYMLHRLALDRKTPSADPPATAARGGPARRIGIPSGVATLGLARGDAFGWDNEFEQHAISVPAFEIDAVNVTNADWLAFMDAGGYARREWWSDAAWVWRAEQRIEHPAFWAARPGGTWAHRGMFAESPLLPAAPVYVSHAEALAYACWRGGALPTEAQFHRAAYGTPDGNERAYPWGDSPPAPRHGNFDFARWEPVAVGSYPDGDSAFGVADLVGNGWEWTSTTFAPFPGFERFPFYPGYSADFFDGKHFVMKGGSSRTAACMLRRSFRNWFQPHYPYVYAGFRLVGA